MTDAQKILDLVQRRVGRVLDVAEVGIASDRFPGLPKGGSQGVRQGWLCGPDIQRLLGVSAAGTARNGKGRNDDGEKGGAP